MAAKTRPPGLSVAEEEEPRSRAVEEEADHVEVAVHHHAIRKVAGTLADIQEGGSSLDGVDILRFLEDNRVQHWGAADTLRGDSDAHREEVDTSHASLLGMVGSHLLERSVALVGRKCSQRDEHSPFFPRRVA